jgi:hypothetical protein
VFAPVFQVNGAVALYGIFMFLELYKSLEWSYFESHEDIHDSVTKDICKIASRLPAMYLDMACQNMKILRVITLNIQFGFRYWSSSLIKTCGRVGFGETHLSPSSRLLSETLVST